MAKSPRGDPELDESRILLEEIELTVRWGDMDALGHVNNAVYFTYFEQVRVAWLERMSMSSGIAAGSLLGPVVVNAFCAFHQPILYPARLSVRMFAGNPGRSSFDTYYELNDASRRELLYASGSAKVVWVDHREGRSKPLPAEVRRLLPDTGL